MKQVLIIILAGLLVAGISGCKTSEDLTGDEDLEALAAYTTSSLAHFSDYFSDWTSLLTGQATVPQYNAQTGWWTLQVELDTGEAAEVKIKFTDDNGNFTRTITDQTTRIHFQVDGESSEGAYTYDFIMTGVETGSDTVTINGTATSTYNGQTATTEVTDLTIDDDGDSYPESGQVVVTSGGKQATVTFNGTRYATLTYSGGGGTVTVQIDLDTGEIV